MRTFECAGALRRLLRTSSPTTYRFAATGFEFQGLALAKAELAETLPVLGAPVITGPVTWRPPIGIHGPNNLPLRFG